MESSTMFLSDAIFGAILLAMSAFVLYGESEEKRIRAKGRPSQVVVLDKQKDKKGTTSVQVRLPDRPGSEPFWRVFRDADWEKLKPGDPIPYVYEPEFPEAGILGIPRARNNVGMFCLIFGVFVAPFLLIGAAIKRRELRRKASATSPG